MKITHTNQSIRMDHYSPLAQGNGSLSLLIDFTGKTITSSLRKKCAENGIWIAGIRYDKSGFPLVPFGGFTDSLADKMEPVSWEQTLDLTAAAVTATCMYPDGTLLRTKTICPFAANVILIEKEILKHGSTEVSESYHFAPARTKCSSVDVNTTSYIIDSDRDIEGMIAFFVLEGMADFSRGPDTITGRMRSDRVVFVLAFDADAIASVKNSSYAEILAKHEADWNCFWTESKVPADLPEAVLRSARTSEYHLRVSSTKWSIPIGIYPSHWQGRYFGFDAYFPVMGLLASGHLELAEKVPRFYAQHLESAQKRAYSYFGHNTVAARYPWEATEHPGEEGAPAGFWMEHLFHMAHIALAANACAKQKNDMTYTREIAYPVIRACAEFFRIYHVYEMNDSRVIIGKCTDLERLGPARENAFMTTCSAIATFRAASEMADMLQLDSELSGNWSSLSDALQKSLPQTDEKYVNYSGCQEPSIALFSGTYPYDILQADDPKQKNSIQWFCSNERTFGNMYPIGDSLCIWYAGWKALTLFKMGNVQEARELVMKMGESTGNFSEVFEVYETCSHPWFTTAEGIYLEALCRIFNK